MNISQEIVLKSMEISRNMINGAIRFSLGRYSTENDVNRVLEELPNIIKKCRDREWRMAADFIPTV